MRRIGTKLGVGIVVMVLLCGGAFAELLQNGSFESGLTDWSSWNEGSIVTPSDWGWAQDGDAMAGMWWDAGLYQEFSATPGMGYDVSVFAYNPSDDAITAGVIGRVELDWYDGSDTKISNGWSVDFDESRPQDQWIALSTEAVVAPGSAAYGRLNLGIYNDGTGGGRAYYDNAVVTAVPEPGVLGSLSFGAAVMLLMARRKLRRV
jgi:hypothetical protein